MTLTFKVSGDAKKWLSRIAASTDPFDTERLMTDLSRDLAEETLDLVKQGFKQETDPYGKRWPKRKTETRKTKGKPVLIGESLQLRNGWHRVYLADSGFAIAASVEYAMAHQRPGKLRGRFRRAPRKMVPEGDKLGAKWRFSLREATKDRVQLHYARLKP